MLRLTIMSFMTVTLLILLTGILIMGFNNRLNKKFGNKLMIARVCAQLGVALSVLLMYCNK